ncbi:unnamed protein product [Ascophyllum nodosum]
MIPDLAGCWSLSAGRVALVLLSFTLPLGTTAYSYGFDPDKCDSLVVAGAGPGGLYSAWRMIEAGLVDPKHTCIFEQTQRIGGRMRSVRGDELPTELVDIGSVALDVAAYRAWPGQHPFVAGIWKELDLKTGCYHDIAFRTGDCTSECDPARAVHKYLRDKYVPYADTLDSSNVPYNVGVNNTWNINSTYLDPYDWLYGPYAPAFWADNFNDLALNESAAVRFAARDRIVEASRTFEVDGTPSTALNLKQLATTGYNSDGVKMTKEDYDFFIDADCSTLDHVATMLALHDMVVEWANYYANGLALGIGGSYEVPVNDDGKQIGYDIINPIILEKLQGMGAEIYYGFQVARTRPKATKAKWAQVKVIDLEYEEEYSFKTEHVVLNVPLAFIRSVLSDNTIIKYGRDDLFDVFQAIDPIPLFKAYPFYPNAWWSQLYTSGRLRTTLDLYNARYHDGYVQCSGDDYTDCSGVLLGTYVQGHEKGARWANQYFPARSYIESADGFYTVRRGEGPPEQDRFLDDLHTQLMESHSDVLLENGVNTDDIPAPDLCLVGNYLGPFDAMHGRPPSPLPPGAIDEAAVEPFPGYNIHLVNEAYGIPPGWLESSLYAAERMMYHYYGQGKPSWFTDDVFDGFDADAYYNSVIGNSNGDGK